MNPTPLSPTLSREERERGRAPHKNRASIPDASLYPFSSNAGLSGEVHERFNEITAYAPQNHGITRDFLVFSGCRDSENRKRSMRFTPTIFSKLIEPLDRRLFEAIVQRHDGDAYDKSFHSWDHLLALIFT